MKIDRRRALALLGLGAAAPPARAQPAAVAFGHGVASGDPLADRVVLWTRITPPAGAGGDIAYRWTLTPVDRRAGGGKSGQGVTGPGRDYTAKVDVAGLTPGRDYTFQFEAAGVTSPVGRTRTLPRTGVKDVVLAVASCSLYPNGYFHAYQAIADLPRVDAVLHLGDYIYEYGGPGTYGMTSPVAGQRPHDPPHEIVTLADYRRRHAQYKSDKQLQAAHARAAWIVAWDDHETANDSYETGAQNHSPETEGDWNTRKAVALKAYYEWMPIREPAPGTSMVEASSRSFHFGDLASLIMVETRLGARDRQLNFDRDMPEVAGKRDVAGFKARLNDPKRRMMGARQEAWIARELSRSVAARHAWQVIGNQVVMARVQSATRAALSPAELAAMSPAGRTRMDQREPIAVLGLPAALDMWDGYPTDRERFYGLVSQAGARPIVLTGDSHSFWANDLHDAEGRRVACEFGATGVTSPGAGEVAPGLDWGEVISRVNKEVVFNDQTSKGFVLLTLTRDEARADMVAVSSIVEPTFTTRVVKTFRVAPDGKGLTGVSEV